MTKTLGSVAETIAPATTIRVVSTVDGPPTQVAGRVAPVIEPLISVV